MEQLNFFQRFKNCCLNILWLFAVIIFLLSVMAILNVLVGFPVWINLIISLAIIFSLGYIFRKALLTLLTPYRPFFNLTLERTINLIKTIKSLPWFKILIILAIFIFLLIQWGNFNTERMKGYVSCVDRLARTEGGVKACRDFFSHRFLFRLPF